VKGIARCDVKKVAADVINLRVAQVIGAPAIYAVGCRFESCLGDCEVAEWFVIGQ